MSKSNNNNNNNKKKSGGASATPFNPYAALVDPNAVILPTVDESQSSTKQSAKQRREKKKSSTTAAKSITPTQSPSPDSQNPSETPNTSEESPSDSVVSTAPEKPVEKLNEKQLSEYRVTRERKDDVKIANRTVLCRFTVEGGKPVICDDNSLRVYRCPKQVLNVNLGFERYVPTPLGGLETLIEAFDSADISWAGVDFVSFRFTICRFVEAPYMKGPWTIFVHRINGVLYLTERDPNPEELSEDDKKREYRSHLFDHLCTAKALPTGELKQGSLDDPYEPNEHYFVKADRFELAGIKIVIGSQVDAIEMVDGKKQYVEVKMSNNPAEGKVHSFRKFKLLKFWAQNHLGDIPSTVVGFHKDDGIITQFTRYSTEKIPTIAFDDNTKKPFWNTSVCLASAARTLHWLKTNTSDEGVYRIEFYDGNFKLYRSSQKTQLNEKVISIIRKRSAPPTPVSAAPAAAAATSESVASEAPAASTDAPVVVAATDATTVVAAQ